MNTITYRAVKGMALVLLLCSVLFVGFGFERASAVTSGSMSTAEQITLIQKLLDQVRLLQKQLAEIQSVGNAGQKNTCLELKKDLGYRSSDGYVGGEVSALQDYLQTKGYLGSTPTGFYGLMTTEAVKNFQIANGVEGTGYVGSLTRAKIKSLTCTETGTPPIACTMDVKMCSDGSYVGRTAPSCNFAACPTGEQTSTIPKIKTATFSQDDAYLRVSGSNLGSIVTLEYQANCCKPIEGNLSSGTIGKDTYASFNLDTYLGNAKIETLKVRVIDLKGNSSDWKEVQILSDDDSQPSCTLTADKSNYRYGDTIKFTWTNKNATYATFWQDDSGKDHLLVPGDKLATEGSIEVDASVIGSPTVKMLIYNYNGNSSCTESLTISDGPTLSEASFVHKNTVSSRSEYEFKYTAQGWNSGIVLDVEPTVHCDDSYRTDGRYRNCAYSLFDLTQKAGATYYGVQGNPYVKGGALYRFAGASAGTIGIVAYPDPIHAITGNEVTPNPDAIDFTIILRNTVTGATLWSETYEMGVNG